MMEKSLEERGLLAARRCIERQIEDAEIVDTNWSADNGQCFGLVYKVDGTDLVFCEVRVQENREESFPEEETGEKDIAAKRKQIENAAAQYLAEHEEPGLNIFVRFDVIGILVLGESKALLRHHLGVYSRCE